MAVATIIVAAIVVAVMTMAVVTIMMAVMTMAATTILTTPAEETMPAAMTDLPMIPVWITVQVLKNSKMKLQQSYETLQIIRYNRKRTICQKGWSSF